MYSNFKHPHPILMRGQEWARDLVFWVNCADQYNSLYIQDHCGGGRCQQPGSWPYQSAGIDSTPFDAGNNNSRVPYDGILNSPYGNALTSDTGNPLYPSRTIWARSGETNLQGPWTILFRGAKTGLHVGGRYQYLGQHIDSTGINGWSIDLSGDFWFMSTLNNNVGTAQYVSPHPFTDNVYFSALMTWNWGMNNGPDYYSEINGVVTKHPITGTWSTPGYSPPGLVVGASVYSFFAGDAWNPYDLSWCAEFAVWNRYMTQESVSRVLSGIGSTNNPRTNYPF